MFCRDWVGNIDSKGNCLRTRGTANGLVPNQQKYTWVKQLKSNSCVGGRVSKTKSATYGPNCSRQLSFVKMLARKGICSLTNAQVLMPGFANVGCPANSPNYYLGTAESHEKKPFSDVVTETKPIMIAFRNTWNMFKMHKIQIPTENFWVSEEMASNSTIGDGRHRTNWTSCPVKIWQKYFCAMIYIVLLILNSLNKRFVSNCVCLKKTCGNYILVQWACATNTLNSCDFPTDATQWFFYILVLEGARL